MTSDAYERGMAVRREVLGDAYVSQAGGDAFSAPFQEFITKTAWGEVWARDGLDRRSRSMITLALLTGLGRHEELALHVRAALRNGLSEAEISEVLLHTAVYAGVPAANSAFAVARQVLAADELAARLAGDEPGADEPDADEGAAGERFAGESFADEAEPASDG